MKIYIQSSTETKFIYHCTSSESIAARICIDGLQSDTGEVCFTSDLYQAQGYGPICLRANGDFLDQLKIYDINESYSFDLSDYPDDCQGLKEPVKENPSKYIYYLYDIDALNSLCVWERYPEGDR